MVRGFTRLSLLVLSVWLTVLSLSLRYQFSMDSDFINVYSSVWSCVEEMG